jgi:CubicO group peptidase (beta-lactamase class C family)
MKAFEVPGMAVAIVKDGKVVHAKGYGLRRLGERAPVDEHTRFGIASNTKAFTATALGLLVQEGKIEWDKPVIEYLPWFQMWDPWVTREITVRDLLVHRSGLGLGQGDLMTWPPSDYSAEDIARRVRYLKPATSFRSAYAYDNVLYKVSGVLIEEVSGQTYDEFIRTRILDPVGMAETKIGYKYAKESGNVAGTHAPVGGVVTVVKPFDSISGNSAGGINSTAADMAKWLVVQLDSGRVADDMRIFSPRTTTELWSPVTPIPIGSPAPELAARHPNFQGYALGFGTRDYEGHKLVTHTGGLPGYVSELAMIPDIKLGTIVLTNQESGAAFRSITYYILDHYLGAESVDWVAAYESILARQQSNRAALETKTSTRRDSLAGPSLPLDSYVGIYRDDWYGDIDIVMVEGGLEIRFTHTPSLTGSLEHWQYDTFVARWYDRELRADAFVTFSLDPSGAIDEAKMRAVSPATDFSYDFHDLLLKPVDEKAARP